MGADGGRAGAPVHVVVVGGGASGVLVAARTADASSARPVAITIVEPSGRLAAGVAYGTDDPDHLVNVRASAMSADPSDPDDLVDWLRRTGAPADPDAFVARRDYRRYLQDHLERAVAAAPTASLEVRTDRVVGLDAGDGSTLVQLGGGGHLVADRVVLALGNPPPALPEPFAALGDHPAWVPDPWASGVLAAGQAASRVLLVGTGLTMVDVAITLGRDHDAPVGAGPLEITALSRTGLSPRVHLERQPLRPLHVVDLDRAGGDVDAMAERVRARCRDHVGAEYADEDWREVIDAIRPYANALWRRFDREQRERFLGHLVREWDVHRHRMAPRTGARFEAMRADGRLRLGVGRVLEAVPAADGQLAVTFEVDGEARTDRVDLVVNCTGPGRPWLDPRPSLVPDLVAAGIAVPDDLGLGLRTDAEGSLVDVVGRSRPELLVIGPPRRGALFETTAVPEIRSQALHLADRIVTGR